MAKDSALVQFAVVALESRGYKVALRREGGLLVSEGAENPWVCAAVMPAYAADGTFDVLKPPEGVALVVAVHLPVGAVWLLPPQVRTTDGIAPLIPGDLKMGPLRSGDRREWLRRLMGVVRPPWAEAQQWEALVAYRDGTSLSRTARLFGVRRGTMATRIDAAIARMGEARRVAQLRQGGMVG